MAARDFSVEKLKLRRIYESPKYGAYRIPAFPGGCGKADSVYGPLLFPRLPEDRSYTYGSFVMSVDGRIAFPESPDGTLLAKTNRLDPEGGECDFWVLNLLRAASDAVIMGSLTLQREPYLTGRIFDKDLTACREAGGMAAAPLHVVITGTGNNLPIEHKVFRDRDIAAVIASSPEGAEKIVCLHPGRVRPVDSDQLSGLSLYTAAAEDPGRPLLLSVGSGSTLDAGLLLRLLKKGGCDTTLIESPTFLARLLHEKLLDEMFLNTSGIFIGGKALTLGENEAPFSAEVHPHTRVLTIHTHSDSFFYFRYTIDYSSAGL
jgi:riboflavin biosynthesis pyrimidine reductase